MSARALIEKFAAERSFGSILTLLGDLDKSHLTAEQLEDTDIVKVLYRLLKACPDDGVRRTAKGLLSRWKREHGDERRGVRQLSEDSDSSAQQGADGGVSEHPSPVETEGSAGTGSEPEAKSALENCTSSEPVRAKCVQLLLAALRPEPPDRRKAARLAEEVERHVHDLHPADWLRYKARVRSKVANLRNAKHGHLRQGLLSGSLAPGVFARMSAEEMAGPELRRLREEHTSRGVSERQLPRGVEGTRTQGVRCERCGGSDCRVTQVSRGALFLPAWVRGGGPDEDAMTFVTCSGCGQQWYHSGWNCL
uniref:Transcription elongation factor A N-terminal and central domain containing n=1 Tax=Kryptolebias marmoratus TaxID=37003 RepID=A0A3Q2ZNY2_KRYMA